MYHYEDLLKAEQKDLECDLVSLLELNTGAFVKSSPKRAKRGSFVLLLRAFPII